LELITENIDYFEVARDRIDRKKKSLHARTRQIIRGPYRCLPALIFSAIR